MLTISCVRVVACCFVLTAQELRVALTHLGKKLGVRFCGVIVDNLRRELPIDDDQWSFLYGTNRDHDFSAYKEGLSYYMVRDNLELVLFLNDTLFTTRGAYANVRELILYSNLIVQLQVPAICGRTDRYTVLCHRNIWSHLPVYVSSYCFMLNRPAFATLFALSDYADADGLLSDVDVGDPTWGTGLPANFREFIRAFVHYDHPAFTWPGLKHYALDERMLSTKARCIYFEHRLSGEISRDGCLISTNSRKLPRWNIYFAEKLTTWLGWVKSFRWLGWRR